MSPPLWDTSHRSVGMFTVLHVRHDEGCPALKTLLLSDCKCHPLMDMRPISLDDLIALIDERHAGIDQQYGFRGKQDS